MAETAYGVRSYTCSEKTKRPQKEPVDLAKIEKRNANQRRLYVTLENIDEIFSNNNDKYPVCYDFIFNTIQGKVTKFFNTRNYDRKKEVSYDCMNRLYSSLKRKLLKKKDEQGLLNPPPVLFFYLSQFFYYIDLVVYSTVHFGTQDQKYIVQEPEDFQTEDVLQDSNFNSPAIPAEIEDILDDNSTAIKNSIERNTNLTPKQKQLLLKLYKNSYSKFGEIPMSKRDQEILGSIQEKLAENPDLLKDLQEILDGTR